MPKRIFISYSHKDDSFRQELENHLSTMKRNGHIDVWSDRRIAPGQEWKGEIDENLEKSDLVLLLVSSDFVASDYCYDVELKRALEMHDQCQATVVPVIIRHCDWHEAPFGKLQALPEEAKPISSWDDKDKAWLSVVTGLKTKIQNVEMKLPVISRQETIFHSILNKEFYEWLIDTEIELAHRRADRINLDDVFICPDLKVLDNEIDKLAKTVDGTSVLDSEGWKLVFGDEQSGKTSLAKHYYVRLLQMGWEPLLINGENIKNSDVENLMKHAHRKQYADANYARYQRSSKKAVIFDDYSRIKLNRKYQNKLLMEVRRQFSLVIILAIDSFQYVAPEIEALERCDQYEILPFGNLKRSELIEKWISIGVREQIDERDLYQNLDKLKLDLDSFVQRNIVPAKPIYLLTLLQTIEAFSPQKIELTSYGHCYQYLIYRALERAKIKNTLVDSYLNWLSELANAIFESDGDSLSEDDLDRFFEDYQGRYLRIDREKIISDFLNSGILLQRNGRLGFKYRYIYYFYAAKRLAENLIRSDASREKIRLLLLNLHKEDCANIIIFLTHHTKDPWVLDEIQLCMMELFNDCREAALESKDLEFMKEFLDSIPKIVIEQREIEEERKKQSRRKDQAEAIERELEAQAGELDPSTMLAKITRGFKGIELIGQILRNRHGSLDKVRLQEMAAEAYGVGLRFLQCFLDASEASKDEVIKMIEHMLRENPGVDNFELEKEARTTFLLLTYGVIYGVLRKIASSAGSKEASEIYGQIEKDKPTPAVKLINIAIELQFQKKITDKRLKELADEFKSNVTCHRLLQEVVVQHIYMHHVDYKEKQLIAERLRLPIATQRSIELQRKLKM
ncbi:MAG: TIR domain-containing protein [Acidobacteriaceae bacterium]